MNTHKMFPVTSVCIEDIIQMIEDNNDMEEDDLRKVFLIKKAKELEENDMKWIAGKLADGFCNCCFWDILKDRFEQIVEEQK